MARIDLLTAQMRQRAVNRVSIQRDERMQLFGADDKMLGTGAALPSPTIHEILNEIAPMPIDGVPVSFPYGGRDGEFEILVAPEGRGFEIRTLSFAPAQNEPLLNHSTPQPQTAAPEAPVAAPDIPVSDEWYCSAGEQQTGPHTSAQIKSLIRSGGIRRDTYLWQEGMEQWVPVGQSQFKTVLPTLPNAQGDTENTWYYRSVTGQPVGLDRSVLVEKIRSGELTGETWVWQNGMIDWATASSTELASAIAARPMGLPPIGAGGAGAPISSPIGGPRTLAGTGPYGVYGGGDPTNTSGGGADAEVPKGARGLFNVGACLFPVFWCHSMGMPGLATGFFGLNLAYRFVPFGSFYIGIAKLLACLSIGFMGNRLAWRYRRFESIQDFRRCQLLWGVISAAIWAVFIIGIIMAWRWFMSQFTGSAGAFPTTPASTFEPPSGSSN